MSNRRSVVLGVVSAASLSVGIASGDTIQTPLDPSAFTSIGSISAEGGCTFNIGDGNSTPTLTADTVNRDFTLNGVISNGVAIFDFDSIDLPQSCRVTGVGSLPLKLLSRSDVTTGAVSISVSHFNRVAGRVNCAPSELRQQRRPLAFGGQGRRASSVEQIALFGPQSEKPNSDWAGSGLM